MNSKPTTYGHIVSAAKFCSEFMRDGIRQGVHDASIVAQAKVRFPHHKIQDHYPQWYRNEMVRKGIK